MPYAVADVELTRPLPAISVRSGEDGVALLVRRHGRPVYLLVLKSEPGAVLAPDELARAIARETGERLVREAVVERLGGPAPASEPSVTVVRGGGERLVHDAEGEYVALMRHGWTLDDEWRAGVAEAVAEHPDAEVLCGPVLPRDAAELALRGRFEKLRVAPGRLLDPDEARVLAADVNVVVRRDPRLVAGCRSDAEIIARALRTGGTVAYEPRMLVWRAGDGDDARARGAAIVDLITASAGAAPRQRAAATRRTVRLLGREAKRLAGRRRPADPRPRAVVAAELAGGLTALAQRRPASWPPATPPSAPSGFAPLAVVHLDLADGLPPAAGDGRGAFAVLWWRDVPLGHVTLTADQLANRPSLAQAVARAVAPAVGARLFPAGFAGRPPSRFPDLPPEPPALEDLLACSARIERLGGLNQGAPVDPAGVSVLICTRGRPDDLARCLDSLRRLEAAPGEILVVDNDPAAGAARAVVDRFPEVTYLAEPRPGLSVARNAGVRAARGDVIAFVDDDTAVHERWLERLLGGFDSPRVLAVTGLVLPAELETRAQVVFELAMGHSGRGHRPILYDGGFFEPQKPFGVPVWAIGAGANMAFRREAFDRVGLFDERLGAGASGCSEDSELWYRLLAAGWECRYQPDSVVLHWHRRDMAGLRRLTHDYLKGHVAALFVQHARHRHPGNLWRAGLTIPRHLARRTLEEAGAGRDRRTGVFPSEVSGYVAGLRLWRLARRR